MEGLFDYLYQIFFAILLLLIFIFAVVFILQFDNPFRKTKKRSLASRISITTLLVSYVAYLAVFMATFYLICFAENFFDEELKNLQYFLIFFSFVVSNVFMGIRKGLRWMFRHHYRLIHYIFAAINIGFSIYMINILIRNS